MKVLHMVMQTLKLWTRLNVLTSTCNSIGWHVELLLGLNSNKIWIIKLNHFPIIWHLSVQCVESWHRSSLMVSFRDCCMLHLTHLSHHKFSKYRMWHIQRTTVWLPHISPAADVLRCQSMEMPHSLFSMCAHPFNPAPRPQMSLLQKVLIWPEQHAMVF